jgi:hypothetical protein
MVFVCMFRRSIIKNTENEISINPQGFFVFVPNSKRDNTKEIIKYSRKRICQEILTNPTEFGKVVLDEKKRDHCIQNADLEGY